LLLRGKQLLLVAIAFGVELGLNGADITRYGFCNRFALFAV
jgi:hypothetical protein